VQESLGVNESLVTANVSVRAAANNDIMAWQVQQQGVAS